MAEGNPTWRPPIPLSDERLKCRFCDWTCPLEYANATDQKQTPRDGHNRLAAHVAKEHYLEWRAVGSTGRTNKAVRGTDV